MKYLGVAAIIVSFLGLTSLWWSSESTLVDLRSQAAGSQNRNSKWEKIDSKNQETIRNLEQLLILSGETTRSYASTAQSCVTELKAGNKVLDTVVTRYLAMQERVNSLEGELLLAKHANEIAEAEARGEDPLSLPAPARVAVIELEGVEWEVKLPSKAPQVSPQ